MSKKLSLYFAVSSLIIWNAQASDDIQVDLSVLDNIPQDSIGFVSSQPLFPVIKAAPSHKKSVSSSSKKIQKKIKIKKPEPVKPQVVQKVESKPTPSPVVKKIEPKAIQPEEKVENPFAQVKEMPSAKTVTPENTQAEVTQPVEQAESKEPQTEATQPVETAMPKESQTKVVQPIKAPVIEETPKEEKTALQLPESAEKTNQTVQKSEELPEMKSIPQEPRTDNFEKAVSENTEKKEESHEENTTLGEPQNLLSQSQEKKENEVLSAKVSEQDVMNRIPQAVQPKEVFSVSFAQESTELSSEALEKLAMIAQKLNKEDKKKISIKAYNYDNGSDVFHKKRICLNRATEVRSYLLNKGFKNFSIKIINTNMPNDYADTVEIEEMN